YIIREMNRSSTIVDAIGAYSQEDRKVILVACKRGEAVKLRTYIRSVDPKAFMFITNTSEIIGKGFRTV
ncbi:MAG: YitT family protein, partial [Ruminococcus bromii]|nr:YitT family protein [Ruminococcus bromii]